MSSFECARGHHRNTADGSVIAGDPCPACIEEIDDSDDEVVIYLRDRVEELESELEAAQSWDSDDDKPIPEDARIDAAFPTRSGRHDLYAEAMRMVGAKFTKGGLVALVNWLLLESERSRSRDFPGTCEACGQIKPPLYSRRLLMEQRDEARALVRALLPLLDASSYPAKVACDAVARWDAEAKR